MPGSVILNQNPKIRAERSRWHRTAEPLKQGNIVLQLMFPGVLPMFVHSPVKQRRIRSVAGSNAQRDAGADHHPCQPEVRVHNNHRTKCVCTERFDHFP